MNKLLAIVGLGLSLPLAAGDAAACRVPGPRPLPVRIDYSAVVQGTVTGVDEHGAELRVDLIFDGRTAGPAVRLDYGTGPDPDGNVIVSSCGPPGPRVSAGDRVIVVLGTHNGRQHVMGWRREADAEREDEFFALYRAERRPALRRRLLEHWRAVNRHGGPIPLTDPSRWMAPFGGGLGYQAYREKMRARFQVAADGRVTGCEVENPDAGSPRGVWLCARLSRQRFRSPLFARERFGLYEVRWNERPGAARRR